MTAMLFPRMYRQFDFEKIAERNAREHELNGEENGTDC